MEFLGELQLGNAIRVSDPCCGLDVWCAGQLGMRRGSYKACLVREGADFVRSLLLYYSDTMIEPTKDAPFVVGVDSGQCGFFDLAYYARMREESEKQQWYERVMALTQGPALGGVLDGRCVVTRSGGGDGSCLCRYGTDEEGRCVSVRLDFE